MSRRFLPHIGLLLLGLLLFGGLLSLFLLRFRQGDSYPPYSTYRNDPKGARLLYSSLAEIPGVETVRNLRSLSRLSELPEEGGTTLLFLGLSRSELAAASEGDLVSLDRFVREGGRLVLALDGAGEGKKKEPSKDTDEGKDKEGDKSGGTPPVSDAPPADSPKEKTETETKKEKAPRLSLLAAWGFAFDSLPGERGPGSRDEAVGEADRVDGAVASEAALPAALPWHGTLSFREAAPSWKVLYQVGSQPVCLERRLGLGTIVLFSDSVPFGNEAVLRQPEPELLSWTLGDARRIVFDETNHGVAEHPGIASLARRYRLGGFLAGSLVLLGLFLWRSAVGFLPALPAGERERPSTGHDSQSGLTHLLGSRLSPRGRFAACLEEWERSFGNRLPEAASRLARARALLQAEARRAAKEPRALYHALSALLHPPR